LGELQNGVKPPPLEKQDPTTQEGNRSKENILIAGKSGAHGSEGI
jgi:hypothetical protein